MSRKSTALQLAPLDANAYGNIIKSNSLIEARSNLTLMGQKLLIYAISKINRKNPSTLVKIRVQDFCILTGTSLDRYCEIRQALKQLRATEIDFLEFSGEGIKRKDCIAGWISSAENDNGTIEIELSLKLLPYLVHLSSKYTQYEIINVLQLQHKYSIRMYEVLKSYEFKKTATIEYQKLKAIVCGLEKISRTSDFQARVIKEAQKELSEKTDICFTYAVNKLGRNIVGFTFNIFKNDKVNTQRENLIRHDKWNEYLGINGYDLVEISNYYKNKPLPDLYKEFNALLFKQYKIEFSLTDLATYNRRSITNVLMRLVEEQYKKVNTPRNYFKKVMMQEMKNTATEQIQMEL
jgi:plasmid replication initiation protein